jgi:cytochrome b561
MAEPTQRTPVQASARYTRTAISLHWLMFLLMAAGFTIGAYMADMHVSPLKARLFSYHKWIGVTVLGFALIRVLWRLTHRPPPDLPMPRWQQLAAHSAHWLLYALMIATPLVGWLYSSAAGFPIVYLKLWRLPDLVQKNEALAKVLVDVHGFLAWALLWVVVLHALAALKHAFFDRDATLKRMWSWRSP